MINFSEKYLANAQIIWDLYINNTNEPLNIFLKKYFSKNKKFGKRDRNEISEILYNHCRLLISDDTNEISSINIIEKSNSDNFKWKNILYSTGINSDTFEKRFYKTNRLFVKTMRSLNTTEILGLEKIDNKIFSMPLQTKLQNFWKENSYFIQDLASQKVCEKIEVKGDSIWETCAGAGGKSLQLALRYPKFKHFCSDIRVQILVNLKKTIWIISVAIAKLFCI